MNYNKMNRSHSLLYDEKLFLSYQKVPKVKIACSYSKEGDLYWLEDAPLTLLKVVVVGCKNWEIFKIRCVIAE